ncbi:MAG: tetratricopeptide repeat protein [Actinomycetota bacterium]
MAKKRRDDLGKSAGKGRLPLLLLAAVVLLALAAWVWREPMELAFVRRQSLSAQEDYVRRRPDSPAAAALLAKAYLAADRTHEARVLLDGAVERFPERAELRTLLARALSAEGNGPAAYGQLQVAVHSLGADDAETWHWLGRVEAAAGKAQDAQKHFEQALRKNPRHVPTLLLLARDAKATDRFSEAEAYFHSALKADPNSTTAAVGLAEMSFRRRNPAEAVAAARRAVALAPRDSEANLWLARSLHAQDGPGTAREAEAAYRLAIEASSEKWTPRFHLAQLLRETGRLAEAEKELELNVRENPLHDVSFYELSLCAGALGHRERAQSAMQRFKKLNRLSLESAQYEYQLRVTPQNVPLRLKLAQLYFRNGRPDLARPEVEQILRREPEHTEARKLADQIAAHPEPSL